jgi:uncharacterized membrane protein
MATEKRHIRWLYDELPVWREKGWIDAKTAEAIQTHYGPADNSSPRRLLGAILSTAATLLTGAGIILILAHNWDDLSRPLRAIISLLPLLASYTICGYTLARKSGSLLWRETAATANLVALAAAIALIAQTYNIPGDLAHYLVTLSILALPAIYLFRSTTAVLLYLAAITLGRWTDLDTWTNLQSYALYWALLALTVPFLVRGYRSSERTKIFIGAVFLSIGISIVPPGCSDMGALIVYALFFPPLISLAELDKNQRFVGPVVKITAYTGLTYILLAVGFVRFWTNVTHFRIYDESIPTLCAIAILLLMNGMALLLAWKKTNPASKFWSLLGIAILSLLVVMPDLESGDYKLLYATTSVVFTNALALGAGVVTFIAGFRRGSLKIINASMLVIGATLLCRFFDTDLSFLARGIAFIVIGVAFLAINMKLGRRFRKERTR